MIAIKLTTEQEARLQAQLRGNGSALVYRRAAALLALHQGQPVKQVAALLGISRQTVYNWLSAYPGNAPTLNLADAPRSGRPSVWTNEMERALVGALQQTQADEIGSRPNWTATLLQRRVALSSGKIVSGETLRRRLRRMGYVWKQGGYVLNGIEANTKAQPEVSTCLELDLAREVAACL